MNNVAVPVRRSDGLPLWSVTILSAAMAILLVALRIMQLGELWLDRTYWLLVIAALGAVCGIPGTMIALRFPLLRRATRSGGWLMSLALVFVSVFMAGMMAGFCLEYLLVSGQFEPNPERPIRGTIFALGQTGVLFLISSPTYLLPWPLPALTLFVTALLAPKLPRKPS